MRFPAEYARRAGYNRALILGENLLRLTTLALLSADVRNAEVGSSSLLPSTSFR
jgi:hypothetical protein